MKGPTPTIRHTSKTAAPEVPKVKRKCGRPRNPIPRHKRVSHINAEHRRRGKIQNGFQMLKELVPKYESSGRDSKADILTKAVEHFKTLERDCEEEERQLQALRAERQQLSEDIARHQKNLPQGQLFDDEPQTADQRFDEHVRAQTKQNWKYFVYSFLMKPLHESYEKTADTADSNTFFSSVVEWAKQNMSQASLRRDVVGAMTKMSTQTSYMLTPELVPGEALQHCREQPKPVLSTTSSSHHSSPHKPHHSSSHKQHHSSPHKHHSSHKSHSTGHRHHHSSHKNHSSQHKQHTKSSSSSKRSISSSPETSLHLDPPPCKKTKSRRFSPSSEASPLFIKTEFPPTQFPFPAKFEPTMRLPVKSETVTAPPVETLVTAHSAPSSSQSDVFSKDVDSPGSYDSAVGLSPVGSAFSDLPGNESSVDQGYDTPSISHSGSPVYTDWNRQFSGSPVQQSDSIFANFGKYSAHDILETICEPYETSSTSSSPGCSFPTPFPQQQQQQQHYQHYQQHQKQQEQYGNVDHSAQIPFEQASFLDQMDESMLLQNVDQNLLSNPEMLMDMNDRSFLSADSGSTFNMLFDDYDYINDSTLTTL